MMNKITFVCLLLGSSFSFFGCSEKDKIGPIADLNLETSKITLAPNENMPVKITSGNGTYTVVSSNDAVATATVSGDIITVTAGASSENAEAVIIVTDKMFKRASIDVNVADMSDLEVDKASVTLDAVQATDKITISKGKGDYKVVFANPLIAKAVVEGEVVAIIGKMNGKTTLTIEDAMGRKTSVAVVVDGPAYAMNLSDQFFCYANFRDIAVVDESVKNLKQLTFELTCKLDGYRGLQTFLGLEGNLIIRGKNDDYKDTHPIQIAGLGDKIMLESTTSFKLNEWMSIALVVDCTQEVVKDKYKLYINGVQDELLVQRQEETHTTVNLASSGDGDRFEIGRAFGQDWRAMRGTIAESRVWTVARTAKQIKDNMCTLAEEESQGLLARWNFSAGVETNYIQDINGGKYETNLIVANAKAGGNYTQVTAPVEAFVAKACPN